MTPTQEVEVRVTKEELAKPPKDSGALARCLNQFRSQFAMALPRHMTPERMIRVALTAYTTTEDLQRCTMMSIAASIVQASILGLEPNSVLGEAYLVPFKDKKNVLQCQLIPGWKGLLKLVRNSGQLKTVMAQTVYEHDEFEFVDGLNPVLRHKRAIGDRGKVVGYWAGALLMGGGEQVVFMTRGEAAAHGQKYSKAYTGFGWSKNFDEMALKTCIRKLCKYLPQSVQAQTANDLIDRAEIGEPQRYSVDIPMEWQHELASSIAGELGEPEPEPEPIAKPLEKQTPTPTTSPIERPAGVILISDTQAKRLERIAQDSGWRPSELEKWLFLHYQCMKTTDLKAVDYDAAVLALQAGVSKG